MTKENLIKLHKHYTFLAAGNFSSEDFNKEYKSKEGKSDDHGFMHMGKLTPDRIKLIVSNAKENLISIERKYPFLQASEPIKKTNSKVTK